MSGAPKVRKARYSFSKLPDKDDTLAVARFLDRYPPKLHSALQGLLFISADRHMIQGAIDDYRGRDREDYPGTRSQKS